MATLSDARFVALRNQGFTGATSEMILQWLQANGATSKSLSTAWKEMLAAQGFPYGHRSDSWYEFLGSLGYVQAMPDRHLKFWLDGGVISPDGVRITDQPDNWSGLEGETATFVVVATSGNASPLTYQWQEWDNTLGWQNLTDGGKVSGSQTDTLSYGPVEVTDQGKRFRVEVCNSFNCIFSQDARITITGATWFINDEAGNRIFSETNQGDLETVSEDSP